jgi:hypothetical protein
MPRGASGHDQKDYSNKTLKEISGAKDGDETDDIIVNKQQGKDGLTFLVYADARPKD